MCAGKKKHFKKTKLYTLHNGEYKVSHEVTNYMGNFFFIEHLKIKGYD